VKDQTKRNKNRLQLLIAKSQSA